MASSFSGEVWAAHGESGHIVDNWPFFVEDRAFHASPLVVSVSVFRKKEEGRRGGDKKREGGGTERERQRDAIDNCSYIINL